MTEFSWITVLLNIAAIALAGVAAWNEGTFFPNQKGGKHVDLPFIWHAGVVFGSPVLLSHAFGLWLPQLHVTLPAWVVLFFFSLFLVL